MLLAHHLNWCSWSIYCYHVANMIFFCIFIHLDRMNIQNGTRCNQHIDLICCIRRLYCVPAYKHNIDCWLKWCAMINLDYMWNVCHFPIEFVFQPLHEYQFCHRYKICWRIQTPRLNRRLPSRLYTFLFHADLTLLFNGNFRIFL